MKPRQLNIQRTPLPIESVFFQEDVATNTVIDNTGKQDKKRIQDPVHWNRYYFDYPPEWVTSDTGEDIVGVRSLWLLNKQRHIKFTLFLRKYAKVHFRTAYNSVHGTNYAIQRLDKTQISGEELHTIVAKISKEHISVCSIPVDVIIKHDEDFRKIGEYIESHLEAFIPQMNANNSGWIFTLNPHFVQQSMDVKFGNRNKDITVDETYSDDERIFKLVFISPRNTDKYSDNYENGDLDCYVDIAIMKSEESLKKLYDDKYKLLTDDKRLGWDKTDYFNDDVCDVFNIALENSESYQNRFSYFMNFHRKLELKNLWDRHTCKVFASFANQSNHYYVGNSHVMFTPIKYYKLNSRDSRFWKQVFSPTATYLKDTYAFYAKYLYDMAREQSALDGKVPDVVPSCGMESCACVWGDAACIIPWNLYLFYGDKSILEDQFESMRSWVDYVRKVDGDDHGWRYVFHYGDWLALDNPKGGAEEVMGATDEEFIANLYYAVSAGLVAKAARVLDRQEEEEVYQKLSDEQFAVVKNEYYSATGRCCIKTQTALILTLKYHLSDNIALTKKQLEKLFEDSGNKLKTGFVGTPLLCNVLSDHGYDRLAYTLLLNEEYPGWLNEVKLGATTVWERWNSLLSDGKISGISMNSMNHYAYGSVEEWMFRHCAGIQPCEDAPGFTKVGFIPVLNWELRSMDGRYDSPSGLWRCAWELTDPSHVKLSVSVPFGCSATLRLPMAGEKVYEKANPMFVSVKDGLCYLEPGNYTVEYETVESLDIK